MKNYENNLVSEIISDEDFENLFNDTEILSKYQYIVVDFFAQWCRPCKTIAPDYIKLASKYSNLKFIKIDVDNCSDTSDNYKIGNLPTFLTINLQNKFVENRIEGADIAAVETMCNQYSKI